MGLASQGRARRLLMVASWTGPTLRTSCRVGNEQQVSSAMLGLRLRGLIISPLCVNNHALVWQHYLEVVLDGKMATRH